MKLDREDPRLTAFALGEIDDERERREVETLVAESQEAREVVEEIQKTASLLSDELGRESTVKLTEAGRQSIEARLEKKPRRGRFVMWMGAAAATVLFVYSVPVFYSSRLPTMRPAAPAPLRAVLPSPARTESTPDDSPAPEGNSASNPQPDSMVTAPVEGGSDDLYMRVSPGVQGGVPGGVLRGVVGGVAEGESSALDPQTLQRLQALGYISGDGGVTAGVAYGPPLATHLDIQRVEPPFHTEAYDRLEDSPFLDVGRNPLSTFSIDVDTASYANVRRFLEHGSLPPKDAVRIEEMINYFGYDYPNPRGEHPFSVNVEIADAPWAPEHRLMRIGLKGTPIDLDERPPGNFVFLLDVSGSMEPQNKLPLLKRAMRLFVEGLNDGDRVAIVVYAGASGMVLSSTPGAEKWRILQALDRLHAGGSTNGGAGINLAYDTAAENFISGGINRVVLATDGDFNVGVTSQGELTRLIEERAESGVFLSVLGFGMGNYKDSTLEKLADRGNGNYAYIDSIAEARKVLVQEMAATLVTIAKDVKIQIEFNPELVQSYRLIGYENRLLRAEDFNDDEKDAGEIGAGHTVTALYELVPTGSESVDSAVDPLKYQRPLEIAPAAQNGELLTVKLRYKDPAGDTSRLIEHPVRDDGTDYARASEDFKFAAAVGSFGMILRDSPHKGSATLDSVLELAGEGLSFDEDGYRSQFVELVRKAKPLLAK